MKVLVVNCFPQASPLAAVRADARSGQNLQGSRRFDEFLSVLKTYFDPQTTIIEACTHREEHLSVQQVWAGPRAAKPPS